MIKMRVNKFQGATCCECGNGRKESLDLFDICIGGDIITICDQCNEMLLKKTLAASCKVNNRVKSTQDMIVIRNRTKINKEDIV